EARERAGLSQLELGRRAGVAQSVISAYESGRRQPALPTLAGLIAAAGYDLDVVLRRRGARAPEMSGPLGRRVRARRSELVEVAARHGVTNLRVFGSVARSEDDAASDVDLLVDLPPNMGLLGLARLQRELENIVQARIDLVPAGDLKLEVAAQVLSDVVAL
ncbi:MAG: helix-turn-helix domain-containing protein, partial [Actinomycetota bacterium]|nr:helix-turn-helix domain-containing protein [Actinomycetota bacterium]